VKVFGDRYSTTTSSSSPKKPTSERNHNDGGLAVTARGPCRALLTFCGKGFSANQEIAPQLSFWQVVPAIGQPHPGLAMQRNAPTVYFDHVIHKPPIRTLSRRSLIVSCIRRVSGLQSVIEGRGGTIKLYPMGAKVWRLSSKSCKWTGRWN